MQVMMNSQEGPCNFCQTYGKLSIQYEVDNRWYYVLTHEHVMTSVRRADGMETLSLLSSPCRLDARIDVLRTFR